MKIKLPEHFFFLDVIKNLTLRRPASDNVGNAKFRSFPMVLRMRHGIITDLEHGLTALSLAEMHTVGTWFALIAHAQHFWPLASSSSHPLFPFYSLVCLWSRCRPTLLLAISSLSLPLCILQVKHIYSHSVYGFILRANLTNGWIQWFFFFKMDPFSNTPLKRIGMILASLHPVTLTSLWFLLLDYRLLVMFKLSPECLHYLHFGVRSICLPAVTPACISQLWLLVPSVSF